jgi:hypothetical protein
MDALLNHLPLSFRARFAFLGAGVGKLLIGLVGFEPTACRRGDRSTVAYRVHLDLAHSCNTARVVPLQNEWQSFRCELEPRELHVSSPWNRQRYAGEHARSNLRKNRRSAVRFSGCAIRNNKTLFAIRSSYRAGGI